MENDGKLDLYYHAFCLMKKAFETNNMKDDVYNALLESAKFLCCDELILYHLEDHQYEPLYGSEQSLDNREIRSLLNILKEIKQNNQNDYIKLIQFLNQKSYPKKTYRRLQTKNEYTFLPIVLHNNSKYLLVAKNIDIISKEKVDQILSIYLEILQIVLERLEVYTELRKQGIKDSLTNLGNRYSYEKKMKEMIRENNHTFTYALIDLFRLKYINDNYSHATGDYYIRLCAKLLEKYFPKYHFIEDDNCNIHRVETGNYIFRIGGDEFVLITNLSKEEVKTKLEYAKEEMHEVLTFKTENEQNQKDTYREKLISELSEIKNNIKTDAFNNSKEKYQDLELDLNYGIVNSEHINEIDEFYRIADSNLSEDKKLMYQVKHIERRN